MQKRVKYLFSAANFSSALIAIFCSLFLCSCAEYEALTTPNVWYTARCVKPAWSAGILTGPDVLSLTEPQSITNPVLTASDIVDRPSRFVADTFLMPYKKDWLMFFETMTPGIEKGSIAYAQSRDGLHWKYKGVVLDEPFHLSYPYVFEFHGAYYMIPESRHIHQVRLYRADSFPGHWVYQRTLLKGDFADSSIVNYNGRWWIFTEKKPYSLSVFSSEDLHGPFVEHPMSPIYSRDGSKSRPGGRIIPYKGTLMRFAQDSRGGYGHRLRAFIIDSLTPTEYREHEALDHAILDPSGDGWKSQAMHTLDPWQLPDGSWIASIDGAGCVGQPDRPKR